MARRTAGGPAREPDLATGDPVDLVDDSSADSSDMIDVDPDPLDDASSASELDDPEDEDEDALDDELDEEDLDEDSEDADDDAEDEEGIDDDGSDSSDEGSDEDASGSEDVLSASDSTSTGTTYRSTKTKGGSGKTAWDKERTRELFRRYKEEGDMDAREQLVMSHMNLVRYLANKYKNRGEPIEDLMQVGYLGLLKAIDRYDPDRKVNGKPVEFTTFATPTIMGEIRRHFRDKGWSVRVPRRLQELSAKVNKATDTLTTELQRSPTVEEIADYLGEDVDDVLEAMESSSAYSSVSLEAPMGGDSDDAPSVLDRYGTEDDDLAFTDDRLILEDALEEFSPREREVLELRFKDGMTQTQIAEKLGISQVQVSRLLRRTLKKLQDKIDPEGVMSKKDDDKKTSRKSASKRGAKSSKAAEAAGDAGDAADAADAEDVAAGKDATDAKDSAAAADAAAPKAAEAAGDVADVEDAADA